MHASPTVINLNDRAGLTPRGSLAVQLFRVRDVIRGLSPADRAWAADALVVLLAECRAAEVAEAGEGGSEQR
jgi:hypothetical protein